MKVHHVTPILNVSDLAQSFAWFEKLGWKKAWDWGTPPDFGAVCCGDAEIFLCLGGQGGRGRAGLPTFGPGADNEAETGVWMSMWVDDVDAVHRRCVEHGLEIPWPPTGHAVERARDARAPPRRPRVPRQPRHRRRTEQRILEDDDMRYARSFVAAGLAAVALGLRDARERPRRAPARRALHHRHPRRGARRSRRAPRAHALARSGARARAGTTAPTRRTCASSSTIGSASTTGASKSARSIASSTTARPSTARAFISCTRRAATRTRFRCCCCTAGRARSCRCST